MSTEHLFLVIAQLMQLIFRAPLSGSLTYSLTYHTKLKQNTSTGISGSFSKASFSLALPIQRFMSFHCQSTIPGFTLANFYLKTPLLLKPFTSH